MDADGSDQQLIAANGFGPVGHPTARASRTFAISRPHPACGRPTSDGTNPVARRHRLTTTTGSPDGRRTARRSPSAVLLALISTRIAARTTSRTGRPRSSDRTARDAGPGRRSAARLVPGQSIHPAFLLRTTRCTGSGATGVDTDYHAHPHERRNCVMVARRAQDRRRRIPLLPRVRSTVIDADGS